jgi:hypothetical protein
LDVDVVHGIVDVMVDVTKPGFGYVESLHEMQGAKLEGDSIPAGNGTAGVARGIDGEGFVVMVVGTIMVVDIV